MNKEQSMPKFRIEGKGTKKATVILQCSKCDADIRALDPAEKIKTNRGYYCPYCDDGAIHLNLPVAENV